MNRRRHPTNRTSRNVMMVGLLVLLGLSVTACSIEDALSAPSCDEGIEGPLGAQSVPTAQLVPCFESLPDGWDVDNVRIDQEGTELRFDSDRAGDDAAIFQYRSSCDIGDAVYMLSEHDGATRYDHIEQVVPNFRAQRYYVFEGGCFWWEFDFDSDATAGLAIELGERVRTVTRDDLNETFREVFIDEPL